MGHKCVDWATKLVECEVSCRLGAAGSKFRIARMSSPPNCHEALFFPRESLFDPSSEWLLPWPLEIIWNLGHHQVNAGQILFWLVVRHQWSLWYRSKPIKTQNQSKSLNIPKMEPLSPFISHYITIFHLFFPKLIGLRGFQRPHPFPKPGSWRRTPSWRGTSSGRDSGHSPPRAGTASPWIGAAKEDLFFLLRRKHVESWKKLKPLSPRIFIVNHCDLFDKGRYAQNQKAMAAMERWSTEIWETPTQRNCLWRVWIWPSRMVAIPRVATARPPLRPPQWQPICPGTWLPTQAALCLGMHRRLAVHPKTLVDVPFVHIKWLEHGYNFSVFKQPLDVDTVRYDLNMLGCNETYHSGNMGCWPIFHMYRSRIHLFKNTSTLQPRDPRTKSASFSQGIQKIMVSSSGKWYMQLFIVYSL